MIVRSRHSFQVIKGYTVSTGANLDDQAQSFTANADDATIAGKTLGADEADRNGAAIGHDNLVSDDSGFEKIPVSHGPAGLVQDLALSQFNSLKTRLQGKQGC